MKWSIILSLLAVSSFGFASERNLYDLMYLPTAKTFYGNSDLTLTTGKSKLQGSTAADIKYKGYSLAQTVGYSITDRILVSASANYTRLDYKIDYSGSTSTDNNSAYGFSDPALSAKYRLMDDDFIIDIIGNAAFKTGNPTADTHISNNKGPSNINYDSGDQLSVGVQAGQKKQNFQYAGLIQVGRAFQSEASQVGSDIRYDAHNTLLIQASALNKLGERSFLRSFASVSFIAGYHDNDIPRKTKPSVTDNKIGIEYQHLCSTNLLAKVGVNFRNIITNTGVADPYKFLNFNIGMNYQF